jgi:metallo-beta-lactamase class B
MLKKFLFTPIIAIYLVLISVTSIAQTVTEPKDTPANWSQPYPPFRIVGNVYYIGTADLACYLIVTPKGNILINTGLANSAKIIADHITELGFKLADTKILLTTQAHYDHTGAMAELKQKTKAKVMVNEKDAPVMADGGSSDYALGNGVSTYIPLQADQILRNKEIIQLDNTKLIMLDHPGHTKGSCSFILDVPDNGKTYRVLIANMPSIVTEKKFEEISSYPSIQSDYKRTLEEMKNLKFDIWLASHASQFNMHQKHKPGDSYNPTAFIDQKGYDKALADLQRAFEEKVKK